MEHSQLLVGLAGIVVLGVGAQWLSWRLHLPAILLLLVLGLAAGSLGEEFSPDALFGDLLFPAVSLSVGLVLFEGGLSLKLRELREIGSTLRNLILLGSLVTWAIGTLAAVLCLGLSVHLSMLLGAVLVVTGPTVIGPLLRQVRPSGSVGTLLKWEGILIDPLGATLALLVFESLRHTGSTNATAEIIQAIALTLAVGGILGLLGGVFIAQALRRYWIPDFLQNPATLAIVLATFTLSNLIQDESGLLTATVMGIYLANQKSAKISHIIEFKENIRVLLISGLFIILAGRLQLDDFRHLPMGSILFLAIMVVIARPASVAIATIGSKLDWRERAFLGCVAPRGIVAAAVSSIFAFELVESGLQEAALIAPVTFMIIVGTVAIYGLGASPMARRLGVAQPHPQGVLFVGAHVWSRKLAIAIQEEGIAVQMADTNWSNVTASRMLGLPAYYGNTLSEHAELSTSLAGIGRMVAVTPNDETNSLAALHFAEVFGRSEVYQLPMSVDKEAPRETLTESLRGRQLFGEENTYRRLLAQVQEDAIIKKTRITEEFSYQSYLKQYGEDTVPLAMIGENGTLRLFTSKDPPSPQPGQLLIGLVKQENGSE